MINLSGDVLAWVRDAVGAQVIGVEGLRDGGTPWLLRLDGGKLTAVVLRTCDLDVPGMRQQFETEAAALAAAAEFGVAAPRLIAADVDGEATGVLAVLSTAVSGSSLIPVHPTVERLRMIGAQAAALHKVPMQVRPGLPVRDRPIADVDFSAMRRARGLTRLFQEAEAATAQIPDFDEDTVMVHGDLWQGNTMWDGDTMTAMVDWDAAGVGHFGVDLGSLRCDAAIFFGLDAVDEVLAGWQGASDRDAPDPQVVAYWDVVAALSNPPDMADVLHAFHGQGRADLDAATVNDRRETFLRTALDRLKR